MSRISFSNIFHGEYLQYVSKYCERIQKLLNEYDVVIFMARKAICFYESMLLNGAITPTDCIVISSRATEYSILSDYRNKRIAVVDDVVVKGDSLKYAVSRLNEFGISPDVLVIACEKVALSMLGDKGDYTLYDTYIALSKDEIYSFAGMITEYIEASMCPFNIDQPIYSLNLRQDELQSLLYQNHAVNITSGLQQKYGITSSVIFLTIGKPELSGKTVPEVLEKSILKIRILQNGDRVIAIPFVLLPEISLEQLGKLYKYIGNSRVEAFLYDLRHTVYREGQLKLLCYEMSSALGELFFEGQGIQYEKSARSDRYQFSLNTESLFADGGAGHRTRKALFTGYSVLPVEHSSFDFPDILAMCYRMISTIDPSKQHYMNANGDIINNEVILTYAMLLQQILLNQPCNENSPQLASCVIDVLIDRGMIVPSIVHTDSTIVRGYKMGEYSKLTRAEIETFAAMLYQYQEMIQDSLQKTEFEKLCVLFFRQMQNTYLFPQQESFEDGCYSICYSLYGPRVSASAISYQVDSSSALITDFCSSYSDNSRLIRLRQNKYEINPISVKGETEKFCAAFAYRYSILKKLFDKEKQGDHGNTAWNMYVHTYIQFLTLRAIGNNKKNQFLSLCAELFQVSQLPDEFFSLDTGIRKTSERILSGINSGLWKYWCFKGDALNKTTQLIWNKDIQVGSILSVEVEGPSDQRTEWNDVIDKAGELLYRIAFFIQEALNVMCKSSVFRVEDEFPDEERRNSTDASPMVFNRSSYYYKTLKALRHEISAEVRLHANTPGFQEWCKNRIILYKRLSSAMLGLCDLILDTNVPSWSQVDRVLLVRSKTGKFPKSLTQKKEELRLDRLRDHSNVKLFGFKSHEEIQAALAECDFCQELICFELNLEDVELGICKGADGRSTSRLLQLIDTLIASPEETTSDRPSSQAPSVFAEVAVSANQHLSDRVGVSVIDSLLEKIVPYAQNAQIIINITIKGERTMAEFNFRDNNGTITVADTIGTVTNSTNVFGPTPDAMRKELLQLLQQANETDAANVREAIEALDQKDENKFVAALKKIGSFVKDVLSNAAGSALVLYMTTKGIF